MILCIWGYRKLVWVGLGWFGLVWAGLGWFGLAWAGFCLFEFVSAGGPASVACTVCERRDMLVQVLLLL